MAGTSPSLRRTLLGCLLVMCVVIITFMVVFDNADLVHSWTRRLPKTLRQTLSEVPSQTLQRSDENVTGG